MPFKVRLQAVVDRNLNSWNQRPSESECDTPPPSWRRP